MSQGHHDPGGDDRLVATDDIRIPQYELVETFSASGGPGGQHANKAATRVELSFDVAASSAFRHEVQRERVRKQLGDVIRVVVDDERSQVRNRALARERLAEKIRGASSVQKRRRPTKPTRGSQRRRLAAKSQRSEIKQQRKSPRRDD